MANLYVVIIGLFGIAPGTGKVLLRNAVKEKDKEGVEIPSHEAKIRFKGREGGIDLLDKVVTIGSGGIPADGDFFRMSDLFDGPHDLTIRGQYLQGAPAGKLAARVEFKGGSFYPVGVYGKPGKYLVSLTNFPLEVVEKYSYKVMGNKIFKVPAIANGAIWATSVTEPPEVRVGSQSFKLDPEGRSYTVWIENVAPVHPHDDPQIDRHFSLLYDFFESAPEDWWAPVVNKLPQQAAGVTPPGSQCIPPLLG